jgi:hypothetical protein
MAPKRIARRQRLSASVIRMSRPAYGLIFGCHPKRARAQDLSGALAHMV